MPPCCQTVADRSLRELVRVSCCGGGGGRGAAAAFVVANDGLAWLDADEAQLALRRRWGLAWSPDGDGDGNGASVWRKHFCDACHRELNGAREWTIHLASRGHRTAARKAKQRAGRQQRGPAPEPPQPLA